MSWISRGTLDHALLLNVLPEQHQQQTGTTGEYFIIQAHQFDFYSAGYTTTSTTYVTLSGSAHLIDRDISLTGTSAIYVRLIARFRNNTAGQTTYMMLSDRETVEDVPATLISVTGTTWTNKDSGWVDITAKTGIKSYALRVKVTGGTGEFHSATVLIGLRVS